MNRFVTLSNLKCFLSSAKKLDFPFFSWLLAWMVGWNPINCNLGSYKSFYCNMKIHHRQTEFQFATILFLYSGKKVTFLWTVKVLARLWNSKLQKIVFKRQSHDGWLFICGITKLKSVSTLASGKFFCQILYIKSVNLKRNWGSSQNST